MGNPAGVRRMKREKRRAKFEKRLGVVAYVPQELQAEIKTEVAALEAELKIEKQKKAAEKAAKQKAAAQKKAAKKAAAAVAPAAPAEMK
jgi:hypothetical protein